MLRALIVDSAETDRDQLCDLLAVAEPPVQIVGALPSVAAARAWRKNGGEADLYFLARELTDGAATAMFDTAPEFAAVVFVTGPDLGFTARLAVYRLPWLVKPAAAPAVAALLERFRGLGPERFAGRLDDFLKSQPKASAGSARPGPRARPRKTARPPRRIG